MENTQELEDFLEVEQGDNTLYEEKYRTAKKTYRCCECANHIIPSVRYQYVSILEGGMWGHYKSCMRCANVRRNLISDQYPDEVFFEHMFELLEGDNLWEKYGIKPPDWSMYALD